jgi:hypothetical protein
MKPIGISMELHLFTIALLSHTTLTFAGEEKTLRSSWVTIDIAAKPASSPWDEDKCVG